MVVSQILMVGVFQNEFQWPLRSVALRAVMARAPGSDQCLPGPFRRWATSCLQVDSIMPEPICQPFVLAAG